MEKMKAMGSGRVLVEIFPPSDEWLWRISLSSPEHLNAHIVGEELQCVWRFGLVELLKIDREVERKKQIESQRIED